jgi:hypothetical protein
MHEQSTVVVVTNGVTARFLVRPTHLERLVELDEFRMDVSDMPLERDHPDENLGFFLAEVASQISDTMRNTHSASLVVCADEDALASLKSFLGWSCLKRMSTVAANIMRETPHDISSRLNLCDATN